MPECARAACGKLRSCPPAPYPGAALACAVTGFAPVPATRGRGRARALGSSRDGAAPMPDKRPCPGEHTGITCLVDIMALCAACDADIHDANPLAAGVFGLAAGRE